MVARLLAKVRARGETIVELCGAALAAGGIAMIYVPAALIVTGLVMVAVVNLPAAKGRR